MKLKDIGNLVNLIADVGVLVSLMYLGFRVGQNTSEVGAATRHDLANARLALSLALT
ncbi:MAG: hypothetical protein P8J68_01205 [Arenicellaceae bacterium]|nr:hypothetical protein [Arenicellaceae bacterium]